MPATAENLRDLHALHQRAKALRDRLASGPKTVAARQALLANRQAALDTARKATKDAKAQIKNKEVQLQALQAKIDDLHVKRNQVRKQDEYNALTNQIANDRKTMERVETEVLEGMEAGDAQAGDLATLEAEVKALDAEVTALARDFEAKVGQYQAQLAELEAAIVEAEAIIPIDQRDQYRRSIKQRGADAFAQVENGACTGCYLSFTAQTFNELHNTAHLVFCKTCGRILYLAEDDAPAARGR